MNLQVNFAKFCNRKLVFIICNLHAQGHFHVYFSHCDRLPNWELFENYILLLLLNKDTIYVYVNEENVLYGLRGMQKAQISFSNWKN